MCTRPLSRSLCDFVEFSEAEGSFSKADSSQNLATGKSDLRATSRQSPQDMEELKLCKQFLIALLFPFSGLQLAHPSLNPFTTPKERLFESNS